MTYTNVSVNIPGHAPILTGGTANTVSLGLACGTFAAGQPVVGTAYTINATNSSGQAVVFEGYRCLSVGTPKPGIGTFSAQ